MSESHEQIMEELANIRSGLDRIEGQIAAGSTLFEVFNGGLEAYRRKDVAHFRHATAQQMWHIRSQADPDLLFPHRKILECLLRQYDDMTDQFGELHFSALVRQARVSKSRAARYLAALEEKGYVRRRDDGYRVFYRIIGSSPPRAGQNL